MKKLRTLLLCAVGAAAVCPALQAQEALYPNAFPLDKVELTGGPFLHAREVNLRTLYAYDVDRLLAPFLKEAGLEPRAPYFPNWEGLDGHVGGHYLSALAIHYAATGEAEYKRRMEYMIAELKRCQEASGDGYIGGVPNGRACWEAVRAGHVEEVYKRWVPWYNLHKIYAGLRDAWLYAGSEEARTLFLRLCDWGLTVIDPLSDAQMEQMLGNEFGGMDEVYADAFQMTGDKRYLTAAKRFAHRWLLDAMAEGRDNLDNRHANTQVPKVVGYQRIAELCAAAGETEEAERYRRAAEFFWQTVTGTRSLAFGGNSRREHFAPASDCMSYIEEREGPETCNTNNMLKLTEGLFRMHPEARYADFYERAMYNHILSSQHPGHGGYVYFTPARPAHYRVYSQPNAAMWCCVGTGMENHGKYNHFTYTHSGDSLWVNLYQPSAVTWDEAGLRIVQQTDFPASGRVSLRIECRKPHKATLLVRHPQWCADGAMRATVGGKEYAAGSKASSYVAITRKWRNGEVLELDMPMHVSIEEMPNVPNYIAILRGPLLLGARMGTDRLDGLVAGDGRWEHIAHGPLVSRFDTPFLIGERAELLAKLQQMEPVAGKSLTFRVPGLFRAPWEHLELEPFYGIHDCRYMIYWLSMTEAEYTALQERMRAEEQRKLQLDRLTVDAVTAGEQQPEVDHRMKAERSSTGVAEGEIWRSARDGGYFAYELATAGHTNLTLLLRYRGNARGNCGFDLLIDGQVIAAGTDEGDWNRSGIHESRFPIPADLLTGKQHVTLTLRSRAGAATPELVSLRLLKAE